MRFVEISVDVWSGSPKTAWAGLFITVECKNSIQLHYQPLVEGNYIYYALLDENL